MAKRALITGICGLIGSHLAERLAADGWEVCGIDHGQRSLPAIAQGAKPYDITVCEVKDISLADGPFDAVFHMAATVGPPLIIADPLKVLRDHHDDAVAVLNAAKVWRCPVMLASTSEVYQRNAKLPFREDHDLTIGPSNLPRCAYAISKLNVEHLAFAYQQMHGVPVIIPRFFNVVGKRQRDGFVLSNFAKAALSGQPMKVHGNGQQERTFAHVEDVAEALVRLIDCEDALGEIVNVGLEEPARTMLAVARDFQNEAGRYVLDTPPFVEMVPYEATGDAAWAAMKQRRPDCSKLEQLTGFKIGDRWPEIVRDVCADWAERLGVERGQEAA